MEILKEHFLCVTADIQDKKPRDSHPFKTLLSNIMVLNRNAFLVF